MFKEQLSSLLRLQELESRQEELKTTFKKQPLRKYLSVLRNNISESEMMLDDKHNRIIYLEKKLEILEQKIGDSDGIVKQMQERIYSGEVTTVKELKKLKEKHDIARERLDEYEEKALEIMEELENIKKTFIQKRKEMIKQKAEYDDKRLKISREIDKIKKELTQISNEKQELERSIYPELLNKYYKIKRLKREPVASMENGTCNGCMMKVSVMVAHEVKRHEELIYCENCGRILI